MKGLRWIPRWLLSLKLFTPLISCTVSWRCELSLNCSAERLRWVHLTTHVSGLRWIQLSSNCIRLRKDLTSHIIGLWKDLTSHIIVFWRIYFASYSYWLRWVCLTLSVDLVSCSLNTHIVWFRNVYLTSSVHALDIH